VIAAKRTLLYPKSHIFNNGLGLPSNSVFSSLMSLFATPCMTQCNQFVLLKGAMLPPPVLLEASEARGI